MALDDRVDRVDVVDRVGLDGVDPDPPAATGSLTGGPAARLGPAGWARWAWRQLTSMRTALLLLLLLAVAAVPGSVVPQRRIDPGAVDAYRAAHPELAPLLERLGVFDVYSSPWFSAIYLLLFVSLVGCVLPRSRVHLRAIRAAPPRTPRRLSRMQDHRSVELAPGGPMAADAVLGRARAELRRRRYRVASYTDAAGGSLSAERGYLAETGNLVFHLALLALLVAVALGSLLGWSGQALVVEGRPFANAVPLYSSFTAGSRVDPGTLTPFSFTLDRLDVSFEEQDGAQRGAPREFDATLSVTDAPGQAPRSVVVRPNQPLDVDGARAFLVGNGYAPEITVRDAQGRVAFSGPVPALSQDGAYTSLTVVKAPDARPRQIALLGYFLPTAFIDARTGPVSVFPDARLPRLVLTAYAARPGEDGLGVDSGVPQSVFVLDDRNLTRLTTADGEPLRLVLGPGQTQQLPGAGSVTFDGLRRYGVFDVRYDPTKPWVLGGALAALAGLTASLFVRRRRLWVRVSTAPPAGGSTGGGGRTVVEAAGLARGGDAGLGGEVEAVLAASVREQTKE